MNVLATAPPHEPFPPALQGRKVAIVGVAWCGDMAEGEHVLGPLRAAAPPALDAVGPMPYVGSRRCSTARRRTDGASTTSSTTSPRSATASSTRSSRVRGCPEPEAHIVTGWLGGAIDRVGAGETAFGHRAAGAFTWIIGSSGAPARAHDRTWVRDVWRATEPFSTGGVYVNALDAGRPVRDAYADDVWQRLVDVKRRYDPDGVFSGNGIG